MTPAELAITSALGASFLTGFASFGVMWIQQRLQSKGSDRAALAASAQELLARSMTVATRSRAMGDTMRFRSGLREGWDVALRQRKPVDSLELHDWMAKDLAPLNAALTEIWTRDNQEGVRLANDVVNKCAALLGASTVRQPAEGLERLRRWAAGEQWTPEMTKAYDDAMRDLVRARKRYADHVRARFGLKAVELFTSAEADDAPKEIEEGASAPPELPASADRP
jgi:hypothetical protein